MHWLWDLCLGVPDGRLVVRRPIDTAARFAGPTAQLAPHHIFERNPAVHSGPRGRKDRLLPVGSGGNNRYLDLQKIAQPLQVIFRKGRQIIKLSDTGRPSHPALDGLVLGSTLIEHMNIGRKTF